MRARDQVWSEENKPADADPPAGAPQPEQTVPAQSERPQAPPTVAPAAADQPAEETGKVSWLPCVHLREAFFAALADARPSVPAADVTTEARPEGQPGVALAAFAVGSLLLYEQDRAVRKATRQGRLVVPPSGGFSAGPT